MKTKFNPQTFFIVIILLSYQVSLAKAEMVISSESGLKNIFERQILDAQVSENIVADIAETTLNNEISDIDLDIPVMLLPSDRQKIPLYSRPNYKSQKVGYVSQPEELRIIKVDGDFVCVRVSDEKAAWLTKLNIETLSFKQAVQKQREKVAKYLTLRNSLLPGGSL